MKTRLPSLHGRLTTFASGPSGQDGDVELLARVADGDVEGLDVTAQVTSDGVAVVADSDRIRSGLRRWRIDACSAADLPRELPTVAALLARTTDRNPFLVTVVGDSVFEAVLTAARELGSEVEKRLWLVGQERTDLIRWRPRTGAVLLLDTARRKVGDGTEKLLAALHGDDLDGVTMPHGDWSGGTIALAHRFGLRTHASGARHNRELAAVIDAGIDAVSAEDPIRLAAVAAQYYP
ncbi:MAG: hypothetical protein OEZ14_02655 [Acidimicrobiia bacterium]|nr:hypothetical protein [Acidimicrobiia bacterium]